MPGVAAPWGAEGGGMGGGGVGSVPTAIYNSQMPAPQAPFIAPQQYPQYQPYEYSCMCANSDVLGTVKNWSVTCMYIFVFSRELGRLSEREETQETTTFFIFKG